MIVLSTCRPAPFSSLLVRPYRPKLNYAASALRSRRAHQRSLGRRRIGSGYKYDGRDVATPASVTSRYSPECVEGKFSEVVKIHIQFTPNSHPHPLHSIQQPTK